MVTKEKRYRFIKHIIVYFTFITIFCIFFQNFQQGNSYGVVDQSGASNSILKFTLSLIIILILTINMILFVYEKILSEWPHIHLKYLSLDDFLPILFFKTDGDYVNLYTYKIFVMYISAIIFIILFGSSSFPDSLIYKTLGEQKTAVVVDYKQEVTGDEYGVSGVYDKVKYEFSHNNDKYSNWVTSAKHDQEMEYTNNELDVKIEFVTYCPALNRLYHEIEVGYYTLNLIAFFSVTFFAFFYRINVIGP